MTFYLKNNSLEEEVRIELEDRSRTKDWALKLRHFESVHGFERVTYLFNGKFEIALLMNESDPEDDGSFQIEQLISYLNFFSEMHKGLDERLEMESSGPYSFQSSIQSVLNDCHSMKKALKERKTDLARSYSMCLEGDQFNISTCSVIFRTFAIPVIRDGNDNFFSDKDFKDKIEHLIELYTEKVVQKEEMWGNNLKPIKLSTELIKRF